MSEQGWEIVDLNKVLDQRSRELAAVGFELEDDTLDPWPAIPD